MTKFGDKLWFLKVFDYLEKNHLFGKDIAISSRISW